MDNDDETQNMDKPNPTDKINDDIHNEDDNIFKCLECNYESDSRRGLKVNIRMKHKKTRF